MDIQSITEDIDLERRISTAVERGAVPGISVAILFEGQAGYYAYGRMDASSHRDLVPESRFPLGCLSKSLISLLCLEGVVEGRIDLDRPPSWYLPELAGHTAPVDEPTIRHLLTHTGGYREPSASTARWDYSWDEFGAFYREREQVFPPGEVWSYSQTGHAIIAKVLEKIHFCDFWTLASGRILEPLSIALAAHGAPGNVRLHAYVAAADRFMPMRLARDGGFLSHSIADRWLTAGEIARFGSLLCGKIGALEAMAPAIALMQKPGSRRNREILLCGGEAVPSGSTLGLNIYGPSLGLNGSFVGATCGLRVIPEARLAVAVALNAWQPNLRDTIMDAVVAQAVRTLRPDEPPDRSCVATAPLEIHDLVGTYSALMLGMSHAVVHADGRVLIELAGKVEEARLVRSPGGLALVGPHSLSAGVLQHSEAPIVRFGLSAFAKISDQAIEAVFASDR